MQKGVVNIFHVTFYIRTHLIVPTLWTDHPDVNILISAKVTWTVRWLLFIPLRHSVPEQHRLKRAVAEFPDQLQQQQLLHEQGYNC